MPFFAGYHRTMGADLRGLILPSAPGVCAWATPFCPFLAKTGGSRWDRVAKYNFFLPVRSYKRSIWVSVLAFSFQVQISQHAAPPAGGSFSLRIDSTKSSACSPTCWGIFLSWYYRAQLPAPPKRHTWYVAPYSRMHRRFSPINAAALGTIALCCACVNSHGSNGLNLSLIHI